MESIRLCQYKDALGIPGMGFHSARIFGFALNDILGTIGLAFILSKLTTYSFWKSLIFFFLLGVFLHWLFCVPTTFNTLIGLA